MQDTRGKPNMVEMNEWNKILRPLNNSSFSRSWRLSLMDRGDVEKRALPLWAVHAWGSFASHCQFVSDLRAVDPPVRGGKEAETVCDLGVRSWWRLGSSDLKVQVVIHWDNVVFHKGSIKLFSFQLKVLSCEESGTLDQWSERCHRTLNSTKGRVMCWTFIIMRLTGVVVSHRSCCRAWPSPGSSPCQLALVPDRSGEISAAPASQCRWCTRYSAEDKDTQERNEWFDWLENLSSRLDVLSHWHKVVWEVGNGLSLMPVQIMNPSFPPYNHRSS